MEDFKGLFASKTVWGGIIALLAGIAGMFGYAISPEDATTVVDLLAGVGSAIGGLIAIYGRIKATKQII